MESNHGGETGRDIEMMVLQVLITMVLNFGGPMASVIVLMDPQSFGTTEQWKYTFMVKCPVYGTII
jgi:hypothetical protein